MHVRSYLIASAIAIFSINIYSYTCLQFTLFFLTTTVIGAFGVLITILIHILLSSTYKTGIKIESTNKELETFRNKMLVSISYPYSDSNFNVFFLSKTRR